MSAVLAAGCSSGHSATPASSSSTSTIPEGPFPTAPPSIQSDKPSVDEVTAVAKSINERFPQFCHGVIWSLNIQNPPSQHLPRPGAVGTCKVFKENTQILAFTKPADRDGWVRQWTANICARANNSSRTTLYGTSWVLRRKSATRVVTPDSAAVVAAVVHGNSHFQSCTPVDPPAIHTTITNAAAAGAKLDAAGVDCGPLVVAVSNPVYGAANSLVDASSGQLYGLLFQCSHAPNVLVTQTQIDLASKLADGLRSRVKTALCGQNHGTQFVQSGDSVVATADAAVASKVSRALTGSSTSGC